MALLKCENEGKKQCISVPIKNENAGYRELNEIYYVAFPRW